MENSQELFVFEAELRYDNWMRFDTVRAILSVNRHHLSGACIESWGSYYHCSTRYFPIIVLRSLYDQWGNSFRREIEAFAYVLFIRFLRAAFVPSVSRFNAICTSIVTSMLCGCFSMTGYWYIRAALVLSVALKRVDFKARQIMVFQQATFSLQTEKTNAHQKSQLGTFVV